MKHYLSHGMGVNSTALMLILEDNSVEFESIFVNHGGDYPETYAYLDYLQEEGHPVTVITPDVEGCSTLEAYCLKWRIVPSVHFRWCTSKFKMRPIARYIETPNIMFIGIAADEKHRGFGTAVSEGTLNCYPLLQHGYDRDACKDIIKSHGLTVPPRSGCWLCPYVRSKEVLKMKREHPELYEKRKRIEKEASERYGSDLPLNGHTLTREIGLDDNATLDRFMKEMT